MQSMECKICNNSKENSTYIVKEMMFGFREEFNYTLCNNCGCLQLIDSPSDITKYYPDNYYTYSKELNQLSKFKKYITTTRDRYVIQGSNKFFGKLINAIKPASSLIKIIAKTGINTKSRILDIGTGNGKKIIPLVYAGFDVTGIDPYLEDNEVDINGLRIYKKTIDEINSSWDLIILNHVFEHMPDPENVLIKISSLLNPNGKCLIRIPTIPSYAWEKYKTDWVQIDAPRHFFIHSVKSMKYLIDKANLVLEDIIYDSLPYQFLASELYRKDIAMKEGDFRMNKHNKYFSKKELSAFEKKTKELNKTNKGDQAAFIISKKQAAKNE